MAIEAHGLRPAIACALEGFSMAGIRKAWICVAPGKRDIRRLLGQESRGVQLGYHLARSSNGAPDTIRALGDRLLGREVALAFPDIQFSPGDAVAQAMEHRRECGADIALALVPSSRGDKVDLVETEADGTISSLHMKPGKGLGGWTWIAAVWGPSFTQFLLRGFRRDNPGPEEYYFGEVILAALATGLPGVGLRIADGWALDIGTPEDLGTAWVGSQPGQMAHPIS